jgi:hypothetical protein
MYFIYSGYISPDRCGGERPTHDLIRALTVEEVNKYKIHFDENTNNDECVHKYFIVIQGNEVILKPKTVVTEWELI